MNVDSGGLNIFLRGFTSTLHVLLHVGFHLLPLPRSRLFQIATSPSLLSGKSPSGVAKAQAKLFNSWGLNLLATSVDAPDSLDSVACEASGQATKQQPVKQLQIRANCHVGRPGCTGAMKTLRAKTVQFLSDPKPNLHELAVPSSLESNEET